MYDMSLPRINKFCIDIIFDIYENVSTRHDFFWHFCRNRAVVTKQQGFRYDSPDFCRYESPVKKKTVTS
jgi:hypothetical protein